MKSEVAGRSSAGCARLKSRQCTSRLGLVSRASYGPGHRFTGNAAAAAAEHPRDTIFRPHADPLRDLRAGQLHVMLDVPSKDAPRLAGGDGRPEAPRRDDPRSAAIQFLHLNHRRALLQNRDVRVGLRGGHDRTRIVNDCFRAAQADAHRQLNGPFPPGSWASPQAHEDLFQEAAARHGSATSDPPRRVTAEPEVPRRGRRGPQGLPADRGQGRGERGRGPASAGAEIVLEKLPPTEFRNRVEVLHDFDLAYCTFDYADDRFWLGGFLDKDAAGTSGRNYLGYLADNTGVEENDRRIAACAGRDRGVAELQGEGQAADAGAVRPLSGPDALHPSMADRTRHVLIPTNVGNRVAGQRRMMAADQLDPVNLPTRGGASRCGRVVRNVRKFVSFRPTPVKRNDGRASHFRSWGRFGGGKAQLRATLKIGTRRSRLRRLTALRDAGEAMSARFLGAAPIALMVVGSAAADPPAGQGWRRGLRPHEAPPVPPDGRGEGLPADGPAAGCVRPRRRSRRAGPPAGDRSPDFRRRATSGIEFEYVRADVQAGGQTFKDVGLRYKGNGTYMVVAAPREAVVQDRLRPARREASVPRPEDAQPQQRRHGPDEGPRGPGLRRLPRRRRPRPAHRVRRGHADRPGQVRQGVPRPLHPRRAGGQAVPQGPLQGRQGAAAEAGGHPRAAALRRRLGGVREAVQAEERAGPTASGSG